MAGEGLVAVDGATSVEQLRELRFVLAKAIDECDSKRDLAALSNRYLSVVEGIQDLESAAPSSGSAVERIAGRRSRPGGYRAPKK